MVVCGLDRELPPYAKRTVNQNTLKKPQDYFTPVPYGGRTFSEDLQQGPSGGADGTAIIVPLRYCGVPDSRLHTRTKLTNLTRIMHCHRQFSWADTVRLGARRVNRVPNDG